ncbi:hypothetical protein VPH35_046131 [Triticum aestivum]
MPQPQRIAGVPPPQRTPWRNFLGDLQRRIDLSGFRGLIHVARRPDQAINKVKEAPRGLPELIDVVRSSGDSGPVNLITRARLIACAAPPSHAAAIFEVSVNFPLRGHVWAFGSIHTTRRVICRSKNAKEFYSRRAKWARDNPGAELVDFKMTLPPSGPNCYNYAESGVGLGVTIAPTTKKATEEHARVVVDWYCMPMSDRCNTISIRTSMGVVDILCAVISGAVELTMCVGLCIPTELCTGLYGRITARTDIYEPEITVFNRGVKSAINPLRHVARPLPDFLSAESYRHVTLPLGRTVLALPIQASRIVFNGELVIGGSTTVSVHHSIILDAEESEDICSPWVKHENCYTRVALSIN